MTESLAYNLIATAQRYPERPALRLGDAVITYTELGTLVGGLANLWGIALAIAIVERGWNALGAVRGWLPVGRAGLRVRGGGVLWWFATGLDTIWPAARARTPWPPCGDVGGSR